MLWDEMKKTISNLSHSLLTPILMSGLILGGLTKMFGTNEIPKGVVKELMEGVMDGLIFHFDGKIDELKDKNKKLVEKNTELELKNERLEEENKAFKDQIAEAVKKANKKKK